MQQRKDEPMNDEIELSIVIPLFNEGESVEPLYAQLKEALELVRQRMPLPSVCGRVCLHPCETECRRQEVDKSIAIEALKRYITDNVSEELPDALPQWQKEKVAIVGLDSFNGVLKSTSVFEEFRNGDTFQYNTTTMNPSEVTTATVPGGWQFSMIGTNAQQQPLLLMWIIKFTNNCDSYPVIKDGDTIAWTIFVSAQVEVPKRRTLAALDSVAMSNTLFSCFHNNVEKSYKTRCLHFVLNILLISGCFFTC